MVDSRCVVSDCSTNPSQCHVNAQCVSTGEGGYRCVCTEGYNGDGIRQCVEDHIGCNVLNNCGRNAVCGYNQTSANFVCVCQQVCLLNPQIRPRYYRFLADHPLDRRFFSFQSGRERRSSKSTEREEWKSGRGELDDWFRKKKEFWVISGLLRRRFHVPAAILVQTRPRDLFA